MQAITSRLQTHITIDGKEYALVQSYRAAFTAWEALQAVKDGRITNALTAYYIVIGVMLEVDADIFEVDALNEAVAEIVKYLEKYSAIGDEDKTDTTQVMCLEQDAVMLRDAFRLLGTDLYVDDITYAEFMSKLRLMSTTEAPICRIMYLRSLIQNGKIKKKEHANERAEIKKIGESIVHLKKWKQN